MSVPARGRDGPQGYLELDGPLADGPAEIDAIDRDFEAEDTVPIGLVATLRGKPKAEA